MKTVADQSRVRATAAALSLTAATRIDPPHEVERAADASDSHLPDLSSVPAEPPPSAELLAGAAGQAAERQVEQLRAQARQLSGHLRSKQRDLDRREAELNALVAKLESEQRASRLLLREREFEFAERESVLRQTIADLEERAAGVSAVELSAGRDIEESRRLASEFDKRQRDLEAREQRLIQSESLLEDHLAHLAADQRQLLTERETFARQQQDERQALAERQAEGLSDIDTQRQALIERGVVLEQREEAVGQLQADVTRMHREALELRLVTEQLWAQLAGSAAPAELTHSVGRIRARLAEHYRLAEEGLDRQKQELCEMAARLDERQQDLRKKRRDLKTWHASRQEEIEEQAARLVAREQELDRQERQFRQAEQKLAAERRQHQQGLRRLSLAAPV